MSNWAMIEGYDGKYAVSILGEIKRIYPSGHERVLRTFKRKNKYVVTLVDANGKNTKPTVARIVMETFKGKQKKAVVHKNGDQGDNRLANLCYMETQDLGKRYGAKARRRGVAKIEPDGTYTYYTSATEAAAENYISKQTMCDYCNGRTKKIADGNVYKWAEDIE